LAIQVRYLPKGGKARHLPALGQKKPWRQEDRRRKSRAGLSGEDRSKKGRKGLLSGAGSVGRKGKKKGEKKETTRTAKKRWLGTHRSGENKASTRGREGINLKTRLAIGPTKRNLRPRECKSIVRTSNQCSKSDPPQPIK